MNAAGKKRRWATCEDGQNGRAGRVGRTRTLIVYALALSLLAATLAAGCSSRSDTAGEEAPSSAQLKSEGSMDQAQANGTAESAAASSAEETSADHASNSSSEAERQQGFASTSASVAGAERFDRKVIYTANLTMEVEDYGKAQTDIRNLVHLSGGYIVQFSDNKTLRENGGTFVIKVPADGFMSFIAELEKLKPLSLQRSMQGQDVTEEYVDLASRLKAKQVAEERLLTFMEKATKTDELVTFSNRLAEVQEEIERIKGRMRYLDQNVAYSTVEIRLYERLNKLAAPENGQTVLEKALHAMNGSLAFLYGLFEGLFVIAAGALPIALVVAVIAVPAGYAVYRARKRARESTENKRAALLKENKQMAESSVSVRDEREHTENRGEPDDE